MLSFALRPKTRLAVSTQVGMNHTIIPAVGKKLYNPNNVRYPTSSSCPKMEIVVLLGKRCTPPPPSSPRCVLSHALRDNNNDSRTVHGGRCLCLPRPYPYPAPPHGQFGHLSCSRDPDQPTPRACRAVNSWCLLLVLFLCCCSVQGKAVKKTLPEQ